MAYKNNILELHSKIKCIEYLLNDINIKNLFIGLYNEDCNSLPVSHYIRKDVDKIENSCKKLFIDSLKEKLKIYKKQLQN